MSSMCAGRPHCQPQPTARSSSSTVPTTTTTTSTVFQPAPPSSYCVTASVRRRNQRLLLSGGAGDGGGGGATITTAVAECPIRQHQSLFGISNVTDGGGDGASVWSKTWKRRRCPAMVDRVDCGVGAQCGGSCSTTEDSSHIATDCRQRMTNFEKSEDHNQYHPSYKSRHPHHLHPDPQNEHHPCQRSQSASNPSRRLRCCHCSTCIALQASSQPQCPLQPPSLSSPSSEHQSIPPLFAQPMPITPPPPYGDRIESRLPVPLPHREPQQQQQQQSASAFCSRNPPQASATSPSVSSGRVDDHAQTGHQRLHEDGVEQNSRTCRAGIDCWSTPPPPPPSKLRMIVGMIVTGSAKRTLQNNVVAASSLSSARRWRNMELLLRLWCVFLLATTWLAPIVVVATAASSPAAAGGGAAGGLALAGGAGAPKYETAYACEGKTLTIECETGNLINLIRANYGRFSITICNDHGNVDWSVNCMSAKSLRVLHTKCSHKQNCSVLASTNMFGDPCPGTHKYLEAHYQCISAAQTSTTTSKPSPPWLITSQPSVWSTSTVRVPTTTRINIHDAAQQQAAAAAAAAAAVASSSKSNHSSSSHNHQKSAAANGRNGSSSSTTTGRPSTSSLSNLDAEGAFKIQPPDVLEHHQHHHHQQQQHPHRTDTDIDDDDDEAGEAAHDGGAQTVDAATNEGDPNGDQSAAVQNHNRNGSVALLPSASAQPPRHPTGVPLPTCGPKTARNLFWNSTRVGEVNVQPCPGGATGIAKWRCVYAANRNGGRLVAGGSLDEMGAMSTDRSSYTARGPNNAAASAVDAAAAAAAAVVVWLPTTPDLTHCRSLWLNSLEVRVNQRDSSLIGIATDLSQVTSSKTLYGGDMLVTTKIIQTMSEKMTYDIETFADQRQRETVVMELLHGVVRTGSNLLDATQHLSWLDLSFEDQMRVATSLLTGIEDNAFLLAATIMAERNVVQKVKNILLSVRVLETRNIVGNELFPDAATGHTERWPVSDDVIELPRGALIENSDGGLVRIVFVAFDRLETILRPTWTTVEQQQQQQQTGGDGNGPAGQPLTPQQQLLLQYGDGLADTGLGSSNGLADGSIGDATMGGGAVPAIRQRILNSKVISASLGKGRHIQLSQPIRLVLRHLRTENVTNPACVFWNYIDHAWSEDGCYVDRTNHTHTVCMCNHLTNFAILMDVVDDTAALGSLLGLFDETVRRLIYASVAVCVVMVGAALVAVRMFHGTFLKSHRITIAKNLYACVLVLEVLFVVGVSLPETSWLTGFTAAFLHCAFLCTVSWVFVEGFQLYVTLTTEEILLEVEKSSKIIWYYLLTYGLSFSIVAIALAIDPAAYTQSDFGVWMEPTGLFYCTFVTPVLIFVLATIVYAVMSSYILCNKYRTSLKNKEHTRLASVRFYLRCSTAFLLLLITGWTFGYAYMNAIKWDALGSASAGVTDSHSMPSSLNGAGGGGAASASASAGAGGPTTTSTGTTLCGYLFALLNAAQGICLLAIHCTKNDRLRREYSNFVRSQPWLPRCLRCQTSGPQSATISGTPASSGGGGSAGGGVGVHHQQQLQHPSPAIAAASGAKLQQQQQQHTITLERSVGGGGSPAIVGTLRGQLGGQHHPAAAGKTSGAQQHEQPSPVSSAASTHPIYNGYNQQMLIGGDKAADMLLASSADAQKQAASAAEWNVYHQPAAVHALHNHHNPHHHHHHNHHQNNHATTMMHHHNHAMAAGMVGGGPGLGGGGAVALQVSSMTLGGQTAGSASAGGIYFDRPKSGKKSSKANKAGGRQQQLQLLPSPPSPATAAHVHGIGGGAGAGYWTEKPHKRGGVGGVGALQQHHHLHKSGVDLMRSFEQQQQPTTNADMMAGDIMVGDGGAEEYDDDRLPVNYLARYHQQQQRQQQQQQQMHQLQQQQQPYHHHRSTTMMTNDDDDFDDHLGDEGDVMVDTATAAHRRGLLQQQQQHRRAQQQQHQQQQQQHHFYNQYQAPPDHIGYSLEEPVYEEILHNRSSGSGGISTMMELQPPDFQSGGGRGRRRRTAPLSAARNVNDLHDDIDDDIDDGVDHDDDDGVDDDDDDDEDLMMDGRSTNHLMMGGVGGGGGGGGSVNGADDMRSRQSTRPLMMKGLGGSSSSSNTNIAIAEPPPASSSVPYDFGNTARQHLAHGSPGTDHGSHHGHHQQQQHQGRNLSAMLDENNTVVCYLEPVTNQN